MVQLHLLILLYLEIYKTRLQLFNKQKLLYKILVFEIQIRLLMH